MAHCCLWRAGIQMGTRFVLTEESGHPKFKEDLLKPKRRNASRLRQWLGTMWWQFAPSAIRGMAEFADSSDGI